MNVLGLDTCLPALSVALGVGMGTSGSRVIARSEPMQTGHAERMMPLIEDLLGKAGMTMADVDRIAVTIGPGSFTGARIAIAAARAFNIARDLPIVTFSSLEAMALSPSITPRRGEDIAIAIDARRGEVYTQVFDGGTRTPLAAPQIIAVHDCPSLARGRPVVAAGTGARTLAEALAAAGYGARAVDGVLFPDMAAAVERAVTRQPATAPVEPLYLRPPDAKPQAGKTLVRAGA